MWKLTFCCLILLFHIGLFGQDQPVSQEWDQLSLTELNNVVKKAYHAKEVEKGIRAGQVFRQRVLQAPRDSQIVHLVSAYNLLGLLYQSQGQYNESLSHLRQARDQARELLGTHHIEYIIQLGALSYVLKEMGLFDQALPLLEECIPLIHQLTEPDTTILLKAMQSRLILMKEIGRGEETLADWDELVQLYRQFKPKGMGFANVLYNAAAIRGELGYHEGTVDMYRETDAIMQQRLRPNHPVYGQILGRLSTAYYHEGQLDSMILLRQRAMDIAKTNYPPGHDDLAQQWSLLADAFEIIENTEEAVNARLKANEHTNLHLRDRFSLLSEGEQAGLLKKVQMLAERLQSFALRYPENEAIRQSCYDNLLLYKNLLLSNRRQLFARLQQSASDELTQQFKTWEEGYRLLGQQYTLPIARQTLNIDSMEMALGELESELANNSRAFRTARRLVKWEDVQQNLPPKAVAIEFSSFQYINIKDLTDTIRYVAYILKQGESAPLLVPLFTDKELPSLKATRRLYQPTSQTANENLQELIYEPLRPYLEGVEHIFYATDGSLHRINLSAIPVSEEKTMSDVYQLDRLSSTRILSEQQTDTDHQPSAALLFGGINYEVYDQGVSTDSEEQANGDSEVAEGSIGAAWRSLGGADWGFLAWTQKEVEQAGQRLKDQDISVQSFQGQQATEEAFKNSLPDLATIPNVIHLATHGYFFPKSTRTSEETLGFRGADNPLIRSGLILAGANNVWRDGQQLDGQEDGILTAYEIAQLDMQSTELVILSACETALGDIQNGEGVYGLQRAFKLAGAQYILMSLWQVSDRQTQEFMDLFYENWLVNELSIPAAYQATQNELRQRYRLPFNPNLWAGFILIN